MGTGQYMYTYLGIFDKIAEWIFGGIGKAISWLFQSIFGPIFKAILDPIATAIIEAVKSVFFYIFQKFLMLIETIERAAKIFAGAQPVTYGGKDWSILSILVFGDGIIARAIKYMTVLGVLVAFVFAFIALSRSMFDLEPDNKRPIGVVLNSCFKSAIAFLIVPAMCIAGFQLSDAMVTSVYRATAPSGGTNSVADELFLACTMDAGNNLSPKAWENAETVKRQADLSKIDYVTAYICSIFMIWNLAGICFVFIQRMFEMLLLYLASPFFVATMTIDGGERFQKWKNMFIAKAITGIGTLVLLNLFLILVPMISRGTINLLPGVVDTSSTGQRAYLALTKLLFMLGAIMAVKNGGSVLTSIVDSQAGISEQTTAHQTGAMMTGAVMGGLGMAKHRMATHGARTDTRKIKKEGNAFVKSEREYKSNEQKAQYMESRGDTEKATKLRTMNERQHEKALDRATKAGIGSRPGEGKDTQGRITSKSGFKLNKDVRLKGVKSKYDSLNGKRGLTYRLEHGAKKITKKASGAVQDISDKSNMMSLKAEHSYKSMQEGYGQQLGSIRSTYDKKTAKGAGAELGKAVERGVERGVESSNKASHIKPVSPKQSNKEVEK
ncbi:MAG: hypothetical protein RR875_06510 [Clostridium sp.]